MKFQILSLAFMIASIAPSAFGAELNYLRRWVVFPFEVSDPALRHSADDAWWHMREKLTERKRFLVASKQFMEQKDVFQPRKRLSADDVKLLAQLLDADALVTGYIEHRRLFIQVYYGPTGTLFWSKSLAFHPTLKAHEQLRVTNEKLTQEMLYSIPYQGFTVTDPLIGKSVFEETGKKFAVVDVGTTDGVTTGMPIQWVQIKIPETVKEGEIALSGSTLEVLAEGRVAKVKRGVFVAEIQRAKTVDLIKNGTLVRIPSEIQKTEAYVKSDIQSEKVGPEILPTLINPVSPDSQNIKRQTVVFGSIFSILGLLALAF